MSMEMWLQRNCKPPMSEAKQRLGRLLERYYEWISTPDCLYASLYQAFKAGAEGREALVELCRSLIEHHRFSTDPYVIATAERMLEELK